MALGVAPLTLVLSFFCCWVHAACRAWRLEQEARSSYWAPTGRLEARLTHLAGCAASADLCPLRFEGLFFRPCHRALCPFVVIRAASEVVLGRRHVFLREISQ